MESKISKFNLSRSLYLIIGIFIFLLLAGAYVKYIYSPEKVVKDINNTTSLFGLVSFDHQLGFEIFTTEGGNYETPNVSAILITNGRYSDESLQKKVVTFDEVYAAESRIGKVRVGPSNIWGSRLILSEKELREYMGTEQVVGENYVYFNTSSKSDEDDGIVLTTVCEDSFFVNNDSLCAEITINFQTDGKFEYFKNKSEALKFRDEVVASFKFN